MAKVVETIRFKSNDGHAYEAKLYDDDTAREFTWWGDAAEDDIEIPWEEYKQAICDNPQIYLLDDSEWEHFYDDKGEK